MTELILVLLYLALLAIIYLHNIRFLETLSPHKDHTPQGHYLYTQYRGEYALLGARFRDVARQCRPEFPRAAPVGLYFDAPGAAKDPSECRACVGVLVAEAEAARGEAFVRAHPGYALAPVPSVPSLSARTRLAGFLTYASLPWRVYAPLNARAQAEGLATAGSMEVYRHDLCPPTLEVHLPYGPFAQALQLSTYTPPTPNS
eukprot:TRINITY_DN6284_c0_g1_i1.p1 TRINITY_DN6284_c0_g1~~TRINITY_DN6284_c0_g1_i1.p1  ORF type:complete len:202 (+),score=11.91 TRINITY_DN6284_c0_g1_i1:23-628(+)